MDPEEYLRSDFNINKLTIPNLRSILLDHNVEYPSSANKSLLVQLFEEKVKPKANKILKNHQGAASDEGIINMDFNKTSDVTKSKSKSKSRSKSKSKSKSPPTEELSSDKDFKDSSVIPAKRNSEQLETPKKPKRVLKRSKASPNNTELSDKSVSPNPTKKQGKSFLSFEKFDLDKDENDDIFNFSIEETPIKLIPTPIKASPSKKILANFKKSVPSGKIKKSKLKKNNSSNVNTSEINVSQIIDEAPQAESSHQDITVKEPIQNITQVLEEEKVEVIINETFEPGNKDMDLHIPFNFLNDEKTEEFINLTGPTRKIYMDNSGETLQHSLTIPSDSSDNEIIERVIETVEEKVCTEISTEYEDEDTEEEEEKEEGEQRNDGKFLEIIEERQETNRELYSKNATTLLSTLRLFKIFMLIALFFSSFTLLCLREMKLNIGYCGTQKDTPKLNFWDKLPDNLKNQVSFIKPYVNNIENYMAQKLEVSCTRCPEYAQCKPNSEIVCDYGYTVERPIYSILGLIPNQEICVYDTLWEEKMKYLSEYTLSLLHKRKGKELTLDELYKYLKSTKPSRLSTNDFDEFWYNFINYEITKEPKINMDYDTKSVSLNHITPTELLTKTLGNFRKDKTQGLFKKTPPTVALKGYYSPNSKIQ